MDFKLGLHGYTHSSNLLAAKQVAAWQPRKRQCIVAQSTVTATAPNTVDLQTHTSSSSVQSSGNGTSASQALGRLRAKDRLAELEYARQRSLKALEKGAGIQAYESAPRLVDARMYEAAVESQKRMSLKLSEANKCVDYFEKRVDSTNSALIEAEEFLKKLDMEYGSTARMAEAAAAAVRFGVDKEDAITKIMKLSERLQVMQKVVQKQRTEWGVKVPRKVPIAWAGVASQVRLMGDFDNWTTGHELSTADLGNDGVTKTFEADVMLLPGKYKVKFLVDGKDWRLALDWPMEKDEVGETNNLLVVK